jgi:hypothetical protein
VFRLNRHYDRQTGLEVLQFSRMKFDQSV